MDLKIQSRINRSLMMHDLDNLLFQKRQRKTIEPPPITPVPINNTKTTPKPPTQQQQPPQTQQPKQPVTNKTLSSMPNKPLKAIPLKKKKVQTKKIGKMNEGKKAKRIKVKRQQSSQSEQLSEGEDQQQLDKNMIIAQKAKIAVIKVPLVKQQKPHKIIITQAKQKYRRNEKQLLQLGCKIGDRQLDVSFEENGVKKRGRPKKQIIESPKNQIEFQLRPKITFNIELVKPKVQIKEDRLIRQVKPTKEVDIIYQIKAVPKPMVQAMRQPQADYATSRNQRRAKLFPSRTYNQNDEDIDSQLSMDPFKLKKKKKINKVSHRARDKNNKPYSLNRIFRKQVKKNFPSFNLNVNLNELSLSTFIHQFGVFDLIHFSLPISYLHNFGQMVQMMQKGFIFVWVQQKQMQIGYHLLNRWGFDIIDQIIWIKANEDSSTIQADNIDFCHLISDHSLQKKQQDIHLFVNSKSTCLVGYKCPLGNKAEYRTKVSNNIIFGKQMNGMRKPAQIYEIADLMMPGAKKLQFGGQSQRGWLNLKHHEFSLHRCNVCLSQSNLFLMVGDGLQPVKCKRCLINELKGDQAELSVVERRYKSLAKIQIQQLVLINEQTGKCNSCKSKYNQLPYKGLIQFNNTTFCLACFINTKPNQHESIKIVVQHKNYYQKGFNTCSSCEVTAIDVYFECSKCKNHILCRQCFWKNKQLINEQLVNESLVNKKQAVHQWRFKFVKNGPLMKFSCFGCKADLNIPFWCCETCQNWFWCGKCSKGKHETHPHYQTDRHNEYLMI